MTTSKVTRNNLLLALLAALIAAAFWWGLQPRPIPVDLATIGRGSLAVTIDEEGVTRIRDVYTVSAPVSGLLRRLSLKEGDAVKKGRTIVAIIEPIDPAFQDRRSMSVARAQEQSAAAALELARADFTRAEAEAENARADFTRADTLYRKRIIARSAFDQAQATQRSAEAAVAAAKAGIEVRRKELDSAKAALIQPGAGRKAEPQAPPAACCLSLAAPIDGRVLSIPVKSEQVVPAGTPLITLGDDRDIELVVDLLSADAVRIETGAAATIDGWGGPVPLQAKVSRIEAAGFTKVSALGIEEQRVRVVLDLVDAPAESVRLGHDYRINARIRSWQGADLMLVPLSAIFRSGEDWHVYVLADGMAQLRRIRIGHRNQHFAEVLEGLETGDRVITHPSDRIDDGVGVIDRSTL